MAYARASTDNPLGWRPWNSRLSGLDVEIPRVRPVLIPRAIPRRRRFLLGQTTDIFGATTTPTAPTTDVFGAALPSEDQVKSQASGLLGQLQLANQRITALENAVRQSADVARAIGAGVTQLRQKYTDAANKFVQIYSFLFGSAPPGVEGLGQLPVTALLWAVAGIAALIAILPSIFQLIQTNEAKAQATLVQAKTQNTAAEIYAAAQKGRDDALARGDTVAAAAYQQQMNQAAAMAQSSPHAPQSFSEFFQSNWGWMALAVGGIVVAPRLVEGIL